MEFRLQPAVVAGTPLEKTYKLKLELHALFIALMR
jgi:hypothetical protein